MDVHYRGFRKRGSEEVEADNDDAWQVSRKRRNVSSNSVEAFPFRLRQGIDHAVVTAATANLTNGFEEEIGFRRNSTLSPMSLSQVQFRKRHTQKLRQYVQPNSPPGSCSMADSDHVLMRHIRRSGNGTISSHRWYYLQMQHQRKLMEEGAQWEEGNGWGYDQSHEANVNAVNISRDNNGFCENSNNNTNNINNANANTNNNGVQVMSDMDCLN